MRLEGVGYGEATCVGFWRWKVKALIRRVPLRVLGGWLNQNPACTSHWIRLIRKEQGMYRPLILKTTLGSLSQWKGPTEIFVKFIYYRMLVDVAIFHGIIKKGSSTQWKHVQFTCYKDRESFDVPKSSTLIHCHYYLFIYWMFFSPLNLFPSCVFVLPKQIRLMEGSQHLKDPERYMNIYYWVTSEPDRPLAVKGIVRR